MHLSRSVCKFHALLDHGLRVPSSHTPPTTMHTHTQSRGAPLTMQLSAAAASAVAPDYRPPSPCSSSCSSNRIHQLAQLTHTHTHTHIACYPKNGSCGLISVSRFRKFNFNFIFPSFLIDKRETILSCYQLQLFNSGCNRNC